MCLTTHAIVSTEISEGSNHLFVISFEEHGMLT